MSAKPSISSASAFSVVLELVLVVLYGYVGLTSPGFDDEFINIAQVERFAQVELLAPNASREQRLGYDPFYAIKRKLDPRYPEYLVHLRWYRNVRTAALVDWRGQRR
jgi:hypothetical protein